MSSIVVISGSPTKPSRSEAIASYLKKYFESKQHQVETINVRDLPAEDLLHANFNSVDIKYRLSQIKQAQAVIVVSPVYKASYTGILKSFLDLIPEKGLADKIVLPVATGGSFAHLLSLEYAFKPLFSILGSQQINSGVYLVDSQSSYQHLELTFLDDEIKRRVDTALQQLSNQLIESESGRKQF